jgi:uncharacterized membrane protein YhiD involved in acid resistance
VNWFEFEDLTGTFTAADITLTLLVSFIGSCAICFVYRRTHSGVSYSKSFVQSLVILGMAVSIVMLIVGSNVARAFSLVGALSIVRFRNAVKETRDVAFVFLVMIIGMAAGTRFFLLAGITAVVMSLVILVMDRFNWFDDNAPSQILRVQVLDDVDADLEPVLVAHTTHVELLSIDSIRGTEGSEFVYAVQLKKKTDPQTLLRAVREVIGDSRVSLITGYDTNAI